MLLSVHLYRYLPVLHRCPQLLQQLFLHLLVSTHVYRYLLCLLAALTNCPHYR